MEVSPSENSEEKENSPNGEEKRKGRNIRMTYDSTPLIFNASYKVKMSNDAEEYGRCSYLANFSHFPGVLKVTYDSALLYNCNGKQIGSTRLTRVNSSEKESGYEEEEIDEENKAKGPVQKVLIKKKEVYLLTGFTVDIGNKRVEVLYIVFVYFLQFFFSNLNNS